MSSSKSPWFEGSIKAEISTDGSTVSAPCKGLDWNVRFRNTVYFNAADNKQFTINEFSKDIAKGCLEIPGIGGTTTTATTAETTATTGTETTGETTATTAETTATTAETTATTEGATTEATPATTDNTPTETAAKRALHARAVETTALPTLIARDSNSTWLPYNETDFAWIEDNDNDFTDREENFVFDQLASNSIADAQGDTSGNPFEEGDKYITIKSVNGNLQLALDNDGNIRPYSSKYIGIRWEENEGLVFADESTRVLHYYPSTMKKLGVSRIKGLLTKRYPRRRILLCSTRLRWVTARRRMCMRLLTRRGTLFVC